MSEDGVLENTVVDPSLFAEEESESAKEDSLKELKRLVDLYKTLEEDLSQFEMEVKATKEKLEQVSRNLIPSVLNSNGLSEIRLSSGEKVKVEDKLQASIPDKNYTLAYRNMVNEEGGDEHAEIVVDSLFKHQIVISQITEEVLDLLIEHNVPYDSERSIHWQTLRKYCKERLESGKTIPEGISVFQYQETKITK